MHRPLWLGLDLSPELNDKVVDRSVVGTRLETPDSFENLVPGNRLALTFPQELQQLDLVEGQVHRLVGRGERLRAGLDIDVADPDLTLRGTNRSAGSSEECPDSRNQFADRKRFSDVVVGPRFEPTNLVGLLASRRQHDDRDDRIALTDGLAHLIAVHVGQHQVQDNAIDVLGCRELDRLFALGRMDDTVALKAQGVRQPERQRRVVFHE